MEAEKKEKNRFLAGCLTKGRFFKMGFVSGRGMLFEIISCLFVAFSSLTRAVYVMSWKSS